MTSISKNGSSSYKESHNNKLIYGYMLPGAHAWAPDVTQSEP